MKVAIFDTHEFERKYFESANQEAKHDLTFFEIKLNEETVSLAFGFDAVCVFVNDRLNEEVIRALQVGSVKLIALRSTGFNNVDLDAAHRYHIPVVRVPEYSPYAVAEHATALILSLDRKIHRAHQRVREGNFSLNGLVGFDLHGKTVGIVGTGRIGTVMARIMSGFGCRILATDLKPNEDVKGLPNTEYVDLQRIYQESDIITLHVPLTPKTRHLLNDQSFSMMKDGVIVINTGRGALIETQALIRALKQGKVGFAGLDVYEEEDKIFFKDLSELVLQDDCIARLLTFPNVLITSHQGFLTREALQNIARTTLESITAFEQGRTLENEVFSKDVLKDVA
ncbi:MAG: 2-hydroxyacid dehydrogenase [Bdellovibrionia bacterium]